MTKKAYLICLKKVVYENHTIEASSVEEVIDIVRDNYINGLYDYDAINADYSAYVEVQEEDSDKFTEWEEL